MMPTKSGLAANDHGDGEPDEAGSEQVMTEFWDLAEIFTAVNKYGWRRVISSMIMVLIVMGEISQLVLMCWCHAIKI